MFKKRPTKTEQRDQLQAEISRFLQDGGKIEQVEMGETGLVDGRYNTNKRNFDRPSPQERTPVQGLLSVIDSRRKSKIKAKVTKRNSSPRKKIIYDDFGEPVRTIWVDE